MFLVESVLAFEPAAALSVWASPPPKGIPGVDDALNTFMGWTLWIVSVLSLIGLLIVFSVGYEAYRHNQGEQFMDKAKAWVIAAIVGAYAGDIVAMFYPGFELTAVATAIPGLEGPVSDVIGNIIWLLQWAAIFCVVILAIRGFLAYRNDGVQEFLDKAIWWIVASLGVSFVTTIAGAFFPAALSFG